VLERQLTRQERPVIHGNGIPDQLFAAEASLAAVVEEPGADMRICGWTL